jgi:hypothetical protein
MKTKIIVFFVAPLLCISISHGEEKFGFRGEVRQITLKKLPPKILASFEADDEIRNSRGDLTGNEVKALMIGVRKYSKPEDPEWEIYYFYTYHWPGETQWWVGFVVVNYGLTTVRGKIIMEIIGPKTSKIQRNAILQPEEATLFVAPINLASQVGLYTLNGKISGAGISTDNSVTTRFYIYEIW